jgi:hypothetical protein
MLDRRNADMQSIIDRFIIMVQGSGFRVQGSGFRVQGLNLEP